jgi:ribosome biogenesis SPOUT family RNA methylase Rps3
MVVKMDFNELMHILNGQEWVVENEGPDGTGAVIYLGDSPGILILIFKPDGTISFPTRMGFLPYEYHGWQFNEAEQVIEFLDSNQQVTLRYSTPHQNGLHMIMREQNHKNIRRRLIAHPQLLKKVRKLVTPDPQLESGKMIFTKNYHPNSAMDRIITDNVLGVHRIQNELDHISGVRESLHYTIEHPALEKIAVVNAPDIQVDPFADFDIAKIRINRSGTILVASRALLIELLGQVLIEAYHQAFENQIMQDEDVPVSIKDTLETKFKDRVQWI